MVVNDNKPGPGESEPIVHQRERLPHTRPGKVHHLEIAVQGEEDPVDIYITIGFFGDGRIGELFIEMAKEGSTASGLCDAYSRSVSLLLQSGWRVKDLAQKFKFMRFEPNGPVVNDDNEEIRITSSVMDYTWKWLEKKYPEG
ncbi:MAG: hypothetical protein IH951_11635 [Bacteroidetes bacterium]|nr:hypothetical protein [Bacteroidota bacterium]